MDTRVGRVGHAAVGEYSGADFLGVGDSCSRRAKPEEGDMSTERRGSER